MIIKVTKDNFEQIVMQNEKPVFVEFGCDWCKACHTMKPYIEEISEQMKNKYVFTYIDAEDQIDLAMQYHIMTIPTILIIKNGEVINKKVSLMTKENIMDML